MSDLAGRVVAITGGGRGIGLATAEACARAGMRVAIGDLLAEEAVAAAERLPGPAHGAALDVRNRDRFAAFLDEAEASMGPLDVIVNNAGVLGLGPFADEEPASTERMLEVNVGGVLTGTQLALTRFRASGRGGHIVNVASLAGHVPAPAGATYTATKHAVVGFTRALRAELRGSGIRTTIVAPGIINTDMITGFASTPAGRVVEPERVAEAIVAALESGRPEVFVPGELSFLSKLSLALPARTADGLRRLLGADRVMMQADRGARSAVEQRDAQRDRELSARTTAADKPPT